ncbi:SRPBCC domain-containing protein [Nocardia sp. NPDC058658]|uniref:SRPBCC family protein n=1 Tax=Nocardia sp. NPDC058658 TaxID=3346580 RepID=UPI00365E8B71
MVISDPTRDPASVEIGNFLAHAPSDVWHALTDPSVVQRWLMPSTGFVASVGTHFVFTVPPQPSSAARRQATSVGEIACEVLTARPSEQLTLSWVDLRAERPSRWVIDWTLLSQGRGTRLLLTHKGFDIEDRRQKMARNGMERMWHGRLSRLRDVLDIGHQNHF